MELTLVTDPVYFMIQTHTALFVTVLPMRRTHVKQRCAQWMEFGLSGATGHPAVAPAVVGNSSGSEFVVFLMGSLMEITAREMPMKNRLVIVIHVQLMVFYPSGPHGVIVVILVVMEHRSGFEPVTSQPVLE